MDLKVRVRYKFQFNSHKVQNAAKTDKFKVSNIWRELIQNKHSLKYIKIKNRREIKKSTTPNDFDNC